MSLDDFTVITGNTKANEMNEFVDDIKVRVQIHKLIKPTIEKSNEIMIDTKQHNEELKVQLHKLERCNFLNYLVS